MSRAGNDPAFLLKALGEAAGEASGLLSGVPRRFLLQKGTGFNEDWCLLSLAVHLRNVEQGFVRQLDAFFEQSVPRLRHVDTGDVPIEADYRHEDEDEILEELHYLRRHTTYFLWGLHSSEWGLKAEHPFRGRITLLDVAKVMYEHDLEHLWQARRILEEIQKSI